MSTLWAVSDLHVGAPENRSYLDRLVPPDPHDWLLVAGDVAEDPSLVEHTLDVLSRRYHTVVWTPGNHEFFATPGAPSRPQDRYRELIERCRRLGVLTPEDTYVEFHGTLVVPLFTLYDYSFRPPGTTVAEAVSEAMRKGAALADEALLAPYGEARSWCWQRLATSVHRLAGDSRIGRLPTVLMNHWPLVQEPTQSLRYPEIAMWSGTKHTRTWAQRYRATAVVYGHLHMPGTMMVAGIPHHEVSLGYERERNERRQRGRFPQWPFPVLTTEEA